MYSYPLVWTANVLEMKRVMYINTLDWSPCQLIIHIELKPNSNPLPESSDQLSPKIIHENLKASGVDFFEIQILQTLQGKMSYSNSGYKNFKSKLIHKYTNMCHIPLWLRTSHIWSCQLGTITNFLHFILY